MSPLNLYRKKDGMSRQYLPCKTEGMIKLYESKNGELIRTDYMSCFDAARDAEFNIKVNNFLINLG